MILLLEKPKADGSRETFVCEIRPLIFSEVVR